MAHSLRALLVVDDSKDHDQIVDELRREFSSLQVKRISDEQYLAQALEAGGFDLVITDYQLGWTDGLNILLRVKVRYPDCPVIMFAGLGSEEVAVKTLKSSIDDYIVKTSEHYAHLPASVHSVLGKIRQRQALKEAETRYQDLFDGVPIGLYCTTPQGQILNANPALVQMLGYPSSDSLLAINATRLYLDAADRQKWQSLMAQRGLVRNFRARMRHYDGNIIWAQDNAHAVYDTDDRLLYYQGSLEDISEQVQAQEQLQQRNRDLALLNSASQRFGSSLDLKQVLDIVLEQVRDLLDIVASSIWLVDVKTGELVCQHVTGHQKELVKGWRLEPDQGLAGWVLQHGESLVVPDIQADERHFKLVDQQTGLLLRSILSVPLRGKRGAIGTLQVMDKTVNRFTPEDVALLESIATSAAIAIENAQLHQQLRQERNMVAAFLDFAGALVVVLDPQGRIVRFNQAGQAITGYDFEEVRAKLFWDAFPGLSEIGPIKAALQDLKPDHFPLACESDWLTKYGDQRRIAWSSTALFDEEHSPEYVINIGIDITERVLAEKALRKAVEKADQRNAEVSALLQSSRAVLEHREFENAIKVIFDACKELINAQVGYVALLAQDGSGNKTLFLDSGGLAQKIDASLPLPLAGLREQAYRTGKVVYHNDLDKSDWINLLLQGDVRLENVLFAPLGIEDQSLVLVGLGNKPGGFTANDARIVEAFGELAAIALLNSRMLDSLEDSAEQFRSVVETTDDAVVTVDDWGNILFWNKAAERIFGYSAQEAMGQSLSLIMPEQFYHVRQAGMRQVVSMEATDPLQKAVKMLAFAKSGQEIAVRVFFGNWQTTRGAFFTAIIRRVE